jgi:hypothetical protein
VTNAASATFDCDKTDRLSGWTQTRNAFATPAPLDWYR